MTIDPLPKEEEEEEEEEEKSSPHPPVLAQEQVDVEECERLAGRGEERRNSGGNNSMQQMTRVAAPRNNDRNSGSKHFNVAMLQTNLFKRLQTHDRSGIVADGLQETGEKKPAKKTDRPPPLSVVIYGKKDTRKTREGVECECLKCRRKRNTNGGEGAAEAAAEEVAEAAAEGAAAPKKLTKKQAMFAEINTDGSGEVSIDEFRAYMRKKNASITEEQVQQRWKLLDADGGGGISEKELWG